MDKSLSARFTGQTVTHDYGYQTNGEKEMEEKNNHGKTISARYACNTKPTYSYQVEGGEELEEKPSPSFIPLTQDQKRLLIGKGWKILLPIMVMKMSQSQKNPGRYYYGTPYGNFIMWEDQVVEFTESRFHRDELQNRYFPKQDR